MLSIRLGTRSDSDIIADLHAQSWLNTYRGILPDQFLDSDLYQERKRYWEKKMEGLRRNDFVLLAEDGDAVVGFAAVLDKPEAGFDAFIDNLHVRSDMKGKGIGKALMRAVAERLLASNRHSVYLWVLHGNTAAEKFYYAIGAQSADTTTAKFGDLDVFQKRFVWPALEPLLKK
jgi:ribosomal protein S18 acetylase RimI-like enzyme